MAQNTAYLYHALPQDTWAKGDKVYIFEMSGARCYLPPESVVSQIKNYEQAYVTLRPEPQTVEVIPQVPERSRGRALTPSELAEVNADQIAHLFPKPRTGLCALIFGKA